jgi:hypothetical protein
VGVGFELGFAFAKQVLYSLSHTFSTFFSGYFGEEGVGVSQSIFPGWPQLQSLNF